MLAIIQTSRVQRGQWMITSNDIVVEVFAVEAWHRSPHLIRSRLDDPVS
jgi:hypothetical protein